MATILIIDDSKLSRTMSKRALSNAGYDTLEAENGREGLQLLKDQKPDCITLDLLMPEMDGMQVLAAMREQGLKTPVVVVTANVQKGIREECVAAGACDVVNKPNTREGEFLQAVADALRPSGIEKS